MDFDNLTSDPRMQDIFSQNEQACVVQLWLLEYKNGQEIQVSWLYGRALPSNFKNNRWTGSLKGKTTSLTANSSVRVFSFTAYISTHSLKLFAENLMKGESIYEASHIANISMENKISTLFNQVNFGPNVCVRPIMHLPARDYFQLVTDRLSPSSYASYDSGALSQKSKSTFFHNFPSETTACIARIACDSLDADTGMLFTKNDAWRLGDFEFLCAPSLNHAERSKYSFKTKGEYTTLNLYESLTLSPVRLLIVIKSFSDDCLQSTHVATLDDNITFPCELHFHIDSFKKQIATAFTLEILAQPGDTNEAFMCLHIGRSFVRRMNTQIDIHQSIKIGGKTDWLDKQVPERETSRLESARAVQRSIAHSHSIYGGYTDDSWVELNCNIATSIKSLLPHRSSARFFPKLSDSQGMSRLELVAWLRQIFLAHPDAHIAWFDPFMEDVGIDLLHRIGTQNGDYLIFTSEKSSNNDSKPDNSDTPISPLNNEQSDSTFKTSENKNGTQDRILNLLQKCHEWESSSFGNVHLRVAALPDSKVHDRMILIRSKDGLPITGYHFSNSIQRANANHPLLVTPIPNDILFNIFRYVDNIIDRSFNTQEDTPQLGKILFDSHTQEKHPKLATITHLTPFDMPRIGDVFAWWLNIPELSGTNGKNLIALSEKHCLFKEEMFDETKFNEIPSTLWEQGFSLEPFHTAWDAFGKLLCNLRAGQSYRMANKLLVPTLEAKLLQHIDIKRPNSLPPRCRLKPVIDFDQYIDLDLHNWLKHYGYPERIFTYAPVEVECGDYYAVILLWMKSPMKLVNWLSEQIQDWPIGNSEWTEFQVRQCALITTALRHICVEPYHGNQFEAIKALLMSKCPLLQWIGIHMLSHELSKNDSAIGIFDKLDCFTREEKLFILCWLINEANIIQSDSREKLIKYLAAMISQPLSDKELNYLLEPVRGHLGRLYHFTTWVLEALLVPMLGQGVVKPQQIATQWLDDLTKQWEPEKNEQHLFFELKREGAFTDELAILFSYLNVDEQKVIIKELNKIFNKMARNIQKPIAPQIDLLLYSRSHFINLWIYALANRLQIFAKESVQDELNLIITHCNLLMERLSQNYRDILLNDDLIKYSLGDPEKLRTNHLLKIIENIVNKQQ